jgi:hypothetical protein
MDRVQIGESMDEIKILGAKFVNNCFGIPGIEFELELQTSDGPQTAVAIVSEVRPIIFERGLVALGGKTFKDMELLASVLPVRKIPEFGDLAIESTTDNEKIREAVLYFFDAINLRNGVRFEDGKQLPKEIVS